MIQVELCEAEYSLGNDAQAIQWLEKASASYSAFGEDSQVEALVKRINTISGRE
jgi:hypothetical protein